MPQPKDEEVHALSACVSQLSKLEEDEQVRVVLFLIDRFAPNLLSKPTEARVVSQPPATPS